MALTVPQEYLEYIRAHGIFEGFTSDEAEPGYIELWAPEAIPANNRDIEVESLAPGFLAFAGNGGGEVLAFDAAGAVYMLPMIGMASDYAVQVANDFESLAERFVR
ncbi:SMI1/KNR4 family protein [Pseudoduganella namucuonensis]|uniref:SMI1/KNR4 family protein n=1 Tax=Pseudoduganella namucuonensis TaxID=1035707 RepID=UPI0011609ECC|nr:SMI1/KNR4 family protein [Pseudoduganella namucuonensis]